MKRPTSLFELRRQLKKMRRSELTKLLGSPETLGFDVEKHKWLHVTARCCVEINGVLCGQPAKNEVSPERLDRAAAHTRSYKIGVLTWDRSRWLVDSTKRWVCDAHIFDVCQPCLEEPYRVASNDAYVRRRDFAKVVDKVSAAATPAPEALPFVQAERGGARLYHQGRGGEWHERGPALDAALFGSERDVPRHFATHRPPPPD